MDLERSTILRAISSAGGNISKAAKRLGCSRRTLQNRMREYGMPEGKSGRKHGRLPYGSSGGGWLLAAGAAAVGIVAMRGRYKA